MKEGRLQKFAGLPSEISRDPGKFSRSLHHQVGRRRAQKSDPSFHPFTSKPQQPLFLLLTPQSQSSTTHQRCLRLSSDPSLPRSSSPRNPSPVSDSSHGEDDPPSSSSLPTSSLSSFRLLWTRELELPFTSSLERNGSRRLLIFSLQ